MLNLAGGLAGQVATPSSGKTIKRQSQLTALRSGIGGCAWFAA
jgi:hypothetical protein